jgi:DNA polymerase-2
LRTLWRFLKAQPIPVELARTERHDLFSGPMTVLSVTSPTPTAQRRLFYAARAAFPHLTWYDADVPLALRYTAKYGIFPLARCQITFEGEILLSLESRASPWEHDPKLPPLRILTIAPDADPAHQTPRFLQVTYNKRTYRLALDPPRPLLISLAATLRSYDPDLILAEWGSPYPNNGTFPSR